MMNLCYLDGSRHALGSLYEIWRQRGGGGVSPRSSRAPRRPGCVDYYTLSLKVKPCSSVNATFDGHVIRVGPAAAETLYDDR